MIEIKSTELKPTELLVAEVKLMLSDSAHDKEISKFLDTWLEWLEVDQSVWTESKMLEVAGMG